MNKHTAFLKSLIFASLIHSGLTCIGQPDIPVDPFTGRAQVSIPIWTLTNGAVSHNISLTYNGGGMKVAELEGNAGIGWNLIAGGGISREVRSLPDDLDNIGGENREGWLYNNAGASIQTFVPTADNNLIDCTDELSDYNFLNNTLGQYNDSEPDLFSFNAPGLHGSFFFDGNKNLILSPYQDLKVAYALGGNGKITSFTITRNDGVVYIFNVIEETTRKIISKNAGILGSEFYDSPFQTELTFNSSWKLSTITDPSNKKIAFQYLQPTLENESSTYRRVINPNDLSLDTAYVITNLVKSRDIVVASDNLHTVFFTRSTSSGLISTISVNGGVKKFSLLYKEIRDGNPESDLSRKFLIEFNESGQDCFPFPGYRFTYYDIDIQDQHSSMPDKHGFSQDLWGYYNGSQNIESSIVPTIYFNADISTGERFRINPHPTDPGYILIAGANRNTNPATVHFGSLERIYFPPGGFGEITYEAADYYDSLANMTYLGSGVRVASVRLSDGDDDSTNDIITSYNYKTTNGHSSGKFIHPPQFAHHNYFSQAAVRSPDNLAPSEEVYYTEVSVSQSGRGKTIYKYQLAGTFQELIDGDWTAPYTNLARTIHDPEVGCEVVSGMFKKGFFMYPFTPATNYGFERGLLLHITTKSEQDIVVSEKSYSYSRISPNSEKTKAIKLYRVPGGYAYTTYTLLGNTTKLVVSEEEKIYDPLVPANFLTNYSSYQYDPNHYLLRSISSTNSDNASHKVEYRYAKDFAAIKDANDARGAGVKFLNDNKRHGVVIETIRSITPNGGSEVVVSANYTQYDLFQNANNLILPSGNYQFSGTSAFSKAQVIDSSVLKIDTNYRRTNTITAYDINGNVLSMLDNRRNVLSFLYTPANKYGGATNIMPRAIIQNANYNEVFHNLFEFPILEIDEEILLYPSQYVGSASNPFTNHLAMSLPVPARLPSNEISKSINPIYRFTARVRTSASMTLIVRAFNKGTNPVIVSDTLDVTSTGTTWDFIQTNLDISSIPSTHFIFEVETSGPIDIDEVSFYPLQSDITTFTYDKKFDKLSVTNSNGVTSFNEYDVSGRLKFLKDQDKNIVQVNEYQYKNSSSSVVASYAHPTGNTLNVPITFKATPNCSDNLNYKWYVNNDLLHSGINATEFTQTFTTTNAVQIQLIVSTIDGSESQSASSIFKPKFVSAPVPDFPPAPPCAPSVTISIIGSTSYYSCSDQSGGIREFVAVVDDTNCIGGVGLLWQYMLGSGGEWTSYFGGGYGENMVFNLFDISQPQTIYIRCVAHVNLDQMAISNSIGITYHDEGPCP